MHIPFTRHTLDNGLQVIVHEDHHCPIVAVNIWYHVGSQDETPGRTGFAHLFEHLMFEGSAHRDGSYFQPLLEAGGAVNASTSADRTNYWEVVPAGALELALWMESDRMGFLLPALTRERFETQREIVLNERRQNYENRPYGLAAVALSAALFPAEHPYHWLTIGSPRDLAAATLAEARDFFVRYYHPANASLAIAGDVSTDRALNLAEHYFGAIEPGGVRCDRRRAGLAPPPLATPRLAGEQRLVLEDRVELPRLYMAWLSPPLFGPGDAELDLVADLLGGGKASSLHRILVYERRLATDVSAAQGSRELGGVFQVTATVAPGVPLTAVAEAVMGEIARVRAEGPTSEELERSRARARAHFVFRLQSVGGFGGRSDQLHAYNVYVGDPAYFDQDRRRYDQVSVEAAREAARAHLDPARCVLLSVVPRGRTELALPGSVLVDVA